MNESFEFQPSTENEDDDTTKVESIQAEDVNTLERIGEIPSNNAKYPISCINIIGQIEGHYLLPSNNKTTKYEHLIPLLTAIEQDRSIKGLLILLNTAGGDVEAGLGIAELIASMKIPTVSLVLGGGHSIGVPLAVCTKKSFIVPSATMTIHPVRVNGLVLGVPQTLDWLNSMQDRIVKFVCDNSNMPMQKFKSLLFNTDELVMDIGTVLDGKSAVELGLIDSLGGISDALDCLYSLIESSKERYSD
ncbi:MAG: ATP-dependent Clp protease proteolytic subunit [Ruminococcus sp.]|nr:ATP-dependent Clp protease proteolytic subunit [Ruminococcus sp.]MCD7800304.1 ATP-dependent Clp protease proteolytic subunit [Ruminococcus sp.]